MIQHFLASVGQRVFGVVLVLLAATGHSAEPTQRTARVGFVGADSQATTLRGVSTLWERLGELGWVEGRNLVREVRWAEGHYERLPLLMTEVLEHKVDELVTYSTPGAVAAKKATTEVPIVVAGMGDAIGTGVVANLARPGGNLTGLSLQWEELSGKWLELLHETIPSLSTLAVISNSDSPVVRMVVKKLPPIASDRGLKLRLYDVRKADGYARAFKQAGQEAQAALVVADPLAVGHRSEITALAAANRIPTLYVLHEFMDAGGLMAYAPDSRLIFRRAAEYVDKILRGARPGDLPIEQPTHFTLSVNLKAARALRLAIPESILLRAEQVSR